jgi:alkanesulfonate monooxygenase SsuD/methylene tetrahydromethanopterin reductase-like flavin-dependent oxidoreductase (luciferase family)
MIASRTSTGYRWSRNRYRSRTRQSGSAARAEAALKRAVELGDGYIGAGSTPMDTFLEDIKRLPWSFLRQSASTYRWEIICSDYGNGLERSTASRNCAEQVAVWGSPQQIADQIVRLRNAGVNHVLLNPVFDEETQMDRFCEDVLTPM